MASCNELISILHIIVDMLPDTHNVESMFNLANSIIKVLSIYINQCFTYHVI